MKQTLNSPFASDRSVDGNDVRFMKRALNRLGYYTPPANIGITDIPDFDVFSALKKFQSSKGLMPTGTVKPGDATFKALTQALAQKKQHGAYIWRTVGDERVRSSHAAREGTVRLWSDAPDPMEEINCRCWAEEVKSRLKCFGAFGWQDAALKMIKRHEDVTNYPYLDSVGLITIGIGFNVDKVFMGNDLYTVDAQGNAQGPATLADKKRGYDALKGFFHKNKKMIRGRYVINYRASFYRNKTNLRMREKVIMGMARQKMEEFAGELRGKFKDFGCFPSPARIALMDMIWHMGGTRFSEENWEKFFEAVNERDWERAAKESRRTVAGKATPSRNAETYGLIMQAHKMEKEAIKATLIS